MPESTCSIDGCDKPVRTRGWCNPHYQNWYRENKDTAELYPRRPNSPGAQCLIDGCGKPAKGRGWCCGHYRRWTVYGDPQGRRSEKIAAECSIDGCTDPAYCRTWCERHYKRWSVYGDPQGGGPRYERRGSTCCFDGCNNTVHAKGWCISHYSQVQRGNEAPAPLKFTISEIVPCYNCGKEHTGEHGLRRFCSVNCQALYRRHGGPRPTSTNCVQCGTEIDLTARTKTGRLRNSAVKLCRPCKHQYSQYGMTARELANRDGTDCGICGEPVDLTLRRKDSIMCASVDHILPRAAGGSHDPSNLQLSHFLCNARKNSKVDNVLIRRKAVT